MGFEPGGNLTWALIWFETTGAVDQSTTGLHPCGASIEQAALGLHECHQATLTKAPAGVGSTAQHTGIGAGRIDQDPVEHPAAIQLNRLGERGIGLHDANAGASHAGHVFAEGSHTVIVQIHGHQLPGVLHTGRDQHGLAPGRRAGIHDFFAGLGIQQVNRHEGRGILDGEMAFIITRNIGNTHPGDHDEASVRTEGVRFSGHISLREALLKLGHRCTNRIGTDHHPRALVVPHAQVLGVLFPELPGPA